MSNVGLFFFFCGFVSIFACGLRFSQQTLPCIFFSLVCSSFSRKNVCKKNSVFLAASFGDLLLNENNNTTGFYISTAVMQSRIQKETNTGVNEEVMWINCLPISFL